MKINKLEFEGRVLSDVKTKTFGSGKTLQEWSMDVGTKVDGQWKNAFISVKHWGNSAPQRGKDIIVVGRLGAEVWTKDGRDQRKITIVCESFSVVGQMPSANDIPHPQEIQQMIYNTADDLPF